MSSETINAPLLIELFQKNNIVAERIETDRWSFTCSSYAPPEFHCVVSQATLLSRLEELMGQLDAKVGDPRFDQKFLIFSNEPSLVPLWFSVHIQRLMLSLFPIELKISGETLRLEWRGDPSDQEQQANLFSLLELLQDVSKELYAEWEAMAQLCQGAVVSPEPRWDLWRTQIKGTHSNVPFLVYPVRHTNGALLTCVEWKQSGTNESYTIQLSNQGNFIPGYDLEGLEEPKRDELFRPELKERLARLPLSKLEVTQQGIKWLSPGVMRQGEPLRAMLSLITELWPAPNLGPYR